MNDNDDELLKNIGRINVGVISKRQEEKDAIDKYVLQCYEELWQMNEKEGDFINDMFIRITKKQGPLTDGQRNWIMDIHAKYVEGLS